MITFNVFFPVDREREADRGRGNRARGPLSKVFAAAAPPNHKAPLYLSTNYEAREILQPLPGAALVTVLLYYANIQVTMLPAYSDDAFQM